MFFAFCQYPLFMNNGKKSCEAYIFIGSITKELADKASPPDLMEKVQRLAALP